jgi:hypothetical protein
MKWKLHVREDSRFENKSNNVLKWNEIFIEICTEAVSA